jgi:hypothetical protein
MNSDISHHTHLVSASKDMRMLQTKIHKDLIWIQLIGDGSYNLFLFQRGQIVQLLEQAQELRLTAAVLELCARPSVEEEVSLTAA